MMHLPQALSLLLGDTKQVDYVPNKGRGGDALIAEATRQVVEKLKIRIVQGSKTVLVSGGGNLHPKYGCIRRRLLAMPRSGTRIIILPSTVVGDFPLLSQFENLTLMCREELTFKLAKMSGVNAISVHDAGMSLDFAPWQDCTGEGLLQCFRTDCERKQECKIQSNRDLPDETPDARWTFANCTPAARKFVEEISRYSEVHTDRTHVALVASMLGKKVTMFPNNYHKNLSIFKASLESRGNVTFVP